MTKKLKILHDMEYFECEESRAVFDRMNEQANILRTVMCNMGHKYGACILAELGKVRGKQFFFKVRKASGNSVSSQGNTKFYRKVSEKSVRIF